MWFKKNMYALARQVFSFKDSKQTTINEHFYKNFNIYHNWKFSLVICTVAWLSDVLIYITKIQCKQCKIVNKKIKSN